MHSAPELQLVSAAIALWQTFDRSAKADLFSTAISAPDATALIDPISLSPDGMASLQTRPPVRAIVITNQNHWRASAELAIQLSVPIFANRSAELPDGSQFTAVEDGESVAGILEVITIEGGAPGEIVLFSEQEGGTLVIGDALINFEPYGFTFLPAKYCSDHRKMKKSLRRLIPLNFDRMFFAHGLPILTGAKARLGDLLDEP
ncbi:MAG TPA: hypothetical protein VGM62_14730 [Chthoniobacterales bacterium]